MTDFVFETAPRIICESGGTARAGELSRGLGISHLLIVSDAGLVGTGLIEPIRAQLDKAGVATTVFSDVLADPPEEIVMAAVATAGSAGTDGVMGIGGGSSLGTAKLVALLRGTPQT